jgi:thymidylate synthase
VSGDVKSDRTGTGTYSIFGAQLRYDLNQGFPLITTKKVHWHSVRTELLWMLRGDTNVKWLQDHGVTIWDEWANQHGELGPVYGRQWRAFGSPPFHCVDQITNVIEEIKVNPDSRRLIVTAWNPLDVPFSALPPCHMMFQFYVNDGKLSCQVYQRSCDMFLGVPFNIASYALLTHLVAAHCGLDVGDLIWTGGDCHIYANHVNQVITQVRRDPYPFPTCLIDYPKNAPWDHRPEELRIFNYTHHPAIKADIAI